MAHHIMKQSFASTIKTWTTAAILVSITAGTAPTRAESLNDVLESNAMREISRPVQKNYQASIGDAEPESNFGSLWKKGTSPLELATWLGVRMQSFKISDQSAGVFPEYAGAKTILVNPKGVRVFIDIQVPRDSFVPMARLKTLLSFNRFRPPSLNVIAQQVVPIQGINANYYRTKGGSCSLLFDTERYSIVNLRVEKCLDSAVMMEVARNLTFSRLNQKLNS
jgi:hypothetical protein